MKICGLQKTTLLDYPGHVAATIFLGGCNFRCPFCHNGELLGPDSEETLSLEELLRFLTQRASVLEGVCITGGEPTLHPELGDLIRRIRGLGYRIKLDTNGYYPDVLKDLAGKRLLDFVAMDIKSSRERYSEVAGVPGLEIGRIEESAQFLTAGKLPYEFRTTVVKELHRAEDFVSIGMWLRGDSAYYLQSYQDSDQVLCPGFHSYEPRELSRFADILRPYLPKVELRGVD